MTRHLVSSLIVLLGVVGHAYAQDQQEQHLDLRPGDHIAIIGNALADRMQHDGWLETLIYQANPNADLVFRNLAFSGDEVVTRLQTDTGATRTEWLAKTTSDVVLAFYGFNESFAGPAGLPRFKQELAGFLTTTLQANYSGKGAPRLVLFSPIAEESMNDPNLGDPTRNNQNLALYCAAMAETAKAAGVQFVDLFAASQKLYQTSAQRLTCNGIHLTEYGDKMLAPIIFNALFAVAAPHDSSALATLRSAVIDRNETWHSRYRTVDSYNIFGERSSLSYPSGPTGQRVTNATVMRAEMAVRDTMTADRDRRIWAIAKGGNPPVDDANLPAVPAVTTDYRGSNPDGSHHYLGAEEAIAHMTVAKGCKVTLFASEEQFPELVKPVQMAWDTKGRLWVAAWPNYPERTPTSHDGDKILILSDSTLTGKADSCSTFIGDLNCPSGFQFYKDGIVVMESPDLWYVRDSHGGDKADMKERLLMGLDAADSHHESNSMVLDPGGAMYLSDGIFLRTQVETAAGPVRNSNACIYRYQPITQRFERYIPYFFANPHGRVFDYWGTDFVTDGTGNDNFFAPAFSGHLDDGDHPGMKQFWHHESRPCAGTAILSSRQFPAEFQNNFLNCNVIGMQGIFRIRLDEEGSGMTGTTLENLVTSDDPNFHPTGVSVGPDGALYFMDWSNAIIGHMQHHLRDPNRDHVHGRIYRLAYEGRPLLKPARISGASIPALLELLKESEDNVRLRAQLELATHPSGEVMQAVDAWVAGLDAQDPAYQHHLMMALWMHQWDNVIDLPLLKRLLRSSDHHARAAATRVLCYWHDRVPETLALLRIQAQDEHPRVRLEAVRACSFLTQPEAAAVAVGCLSHPLDYYLEYCLNETLRQLKPWWHPALAQGSPLAADNPAGLAYLLATLSTEELVHLPTSAAVAHAIFERTDVTPAQREQALKTLAAQRGQGTVATLLELIQDLRTSDGPSLADACRLLVLQSATELAAQRPALDRLALPGMSDQIRHACLAAGIVADGSAAAAWTRAGTAPGALCDLLEALVLVPDPAMRAASLPHILPLLATLPPPISAALAQAAGPLPRYVRVELPKEAILSLAEVQVYSQGLNIALDGTATQSSTSYGGTPERAIDGRTSGSGDREVSHTQEGSADAPWWEVDLGREAAVEAVRLWNRTDGYGDRLNSFVVVLLDGKRHELARTRPGRAPKVSVMLTFAGDPAGALRRAAIHAALACAPDATVLFAPLAALIAQGDQVVAAAHALQQVPRTGWKADEAKAAVDGIITWAGAIALAHRTMAEVREVLATAHALIGVLDASQAAAARSNLALVEVPVLTIKTVREQMRYDQTRLVVAAGKPFELVFTNADAMPHNLVIVTPGSRARIGTMAMTLPARPDKDGYAFIPKDAAVLAATRLVDAGQQDVLRMTAPKVPGDYEYLCTFPGHFSIMYGKLVVTADVAAYLAEHPDSH